MDLRSKKKLEYDKICGRLAACTAFTCSRELAESLLPADNIDEARLLQKETDEARELLILYPDFTIGGARDIREELAMLEIGGILEPEALQDIAATCYAARKTRSFFSELKGKYQVLSGLGHSLIVLKSIETAVERWPLHHGRRCARWGRRCE